MRIYSEWQKQKQQAVKTALVEENEEEGEEEELVPEEEIESLISHKWLSQRHIDDASLLFLAQFPDMYGLLFTNGLSDSDDSDEPTVQIVQRATRRGGQTVYTSHWLTVDDVTARDSYEGVECDSSSESKNRKCLYVRHRQDLSATFVNVHEGNNQARAMMAFVFAISVAYGEDLVDFTCDYERVAKHLARCFMDR